LSAFAELKAARPGVSPPEESENADNHGSLADMFQKMRRQVQE